MDNKFFVSPSPHIKSKITTDFIMYAVIVALLPTSIFGIYNFGKRAALILLVSILFSILFEYLYEKLMKLPITIKDGSAIVTGLLIGLNMPSTIPIWIVIIGDFFAIIVVKMIFGGLGQNFMNPALAARCFLVISFTKYMTNFAYNGISMPTPLSVLKSGESVNTLDMFLGNTSGVIGETSTLCILIGAIILVGLDIIDFRIPVSYLLSFTLFIVIFGQLINGKGIDASYIVSHLVGGGLMLGAWFMATDYVTSPITPAGKIVFGICCGVLTGLFRIFGPESVSEGVSYAIIISNLLVPLIEKVTIPKPFGREKTDE